MDVTLAIVSKKPSPVRSGAGLVNSPFAILVDRLQKCFRAFSTLGVPALLTISGIGVNPRRDIAYFELVRV